MKNRSWLIFVIFSLFFFISCGGNENDPEQEDASDTEGDNIAVSVRAAGESECTGMELGCLSQQLSAISFQIRNLEGETVFQKSVERKDLKNQIKLTGIKNAENATLIVSVFGTTNGVADLNTVKWQGKATGLKFEKGKTTSVTILLYPKEVQNKEISMPEGLTIARFGHTSTVLADGRILVAGGFTSCSGLKCPASKTVEVIDIESGKVEQLTDMTEERAMHTAIALNDGSVLFIGGVHSIEPNWQEKAFTGYPPMRYVPAGATVKIEKYMPGYPKYNMKTNGFGSPIANISEPVSTTSTIPFSTFQSILAERISDSQIDVFLVGGIDENNVPQSNVYKFTVTETEDGTISVGDVEEFGKTAESTDESAASSTPMLLPAIAYSNGSIIAAGGRPNDSEYAASIISENGREDFGEAKNNIFFTQSIAANGNLYTFGGYEIDSENLAESNINKIKKWNISGKSVSTASDTLLTRGMNVVFPGAIHDQKNNRFLIIGGTNAADIYQAINADSLVPYKEPTTHVMSDKRIMPSAAIVPAGIIGDTPIIVITGGTSSLDGSGSAVKTIKVNNL
ncbi:hypothetical protein J5681_00440 [bacterium]|nr:hypothetical protein [bacterium]